MTHPPDGHHTERSTPLDERDFDELAGVLFSAVVSDVLDGLGYADNVLDTQLRPVVESDRTLVGRARTTVAVAVDTRPERPYHKLLETIDSMGAGDVLVVDAAGDTSSGLFGGLLATAVSSAGGRGAIVYGGVRDVRELGRLDFLTFACGTCPADSLGRHEVVDLDVPVNCGGVEVQSGDLVVGDVDGIVVIPQALESQVIARALEKVSGEGRMRLDLAAGLKASEAFARYGIL